MRPFALTRPLVVILLLLSIVEQLPFSVVRAQPVPVVVKDPQALLLLTQFLNASGGQATIATIQDYTATGTITYNWANQSVQGSVTVLGKALNDFRTDAQLFDGTHSWMASYPAGNTITPNGTVGTLPFFNLLTAGSLTIPAVRIASAVTDTTSTISFVGQITWNGTQVNDVRITVPVDPSLTSTFPSLGVFDVLLDPTTGWMLALTETVYSEANPQQSYIHEIDFSNYQQTGAIVIPNSVSEMVNGQQTWTITISSVVFNMGLTDSNFQP